MYVYLQAYEQAARQPPLVAFVSFYHAQTKVFETQPMEVTPELNNHLRTMPSTSPLLSIRFHRVTITARYPCWTQRERRQHSGRPR